MDFPIFFIILGAGFFVVTLALGAGLIYEFLSEKMDAGYAALITLFAAIILTAVTLSFAIERRPDTAQTTPAESAQNCPSTDPPEPQP